MAQKAPLTRERAEAPGWRIRLREHGRRWVARRGGDVMSDVSLSLLLERVEKETQRLIEEREAEPPADTQPFGRGDAVRAGWAMRFVPFDLGGGIWEAVKDGERLTADTQGNLIRSVAGAEGRL